MMTFQTLTNNLQQDLSIHIVKIKARWMNKASNLLDLTLVDNLVKLLKICMIRLFKYFSFKIMNFFKNMINN